MTGEEMERAIEFLLKSQANAEVRQQRTDDQIAQMGQRLEVYAETQSEFIEIATRTMTGFAEIQAQLAASMTQMQATMTQMQATVGQLVESQRHTDERLNVLIDIVQEGRGGV
jgi:ABC-type transporter Mla subunit MlaD